MQNVRQQRPHVFIGSSSEGKSIADAIQTNLDRDGYDAVVWSQGVFGLSEGTLESLAEKAEDFDFAILVVTADDVVVLRDSVQQVPRDNVLFEIGLFIGALGRRRTFVAFDEGENVKLPSDLAGVTLARFHRHEDGNLQASLGSACSNIKDAMKEQGVLVKPRRLRQLQGVYSVHPDPEKQVQGERVQLRYLGRRTFESSSTDANGEKWRGYITMSEQLPGYGDGIFRYSGGKHGCGRHQVWVNPTDDSIDVHGVNMVGGTAVKPFTYTLRRISGEAVD